MGSSGGPPSTHITALTCVAYMAIWDGLRHSPSTKTRVPRQVEPSGHCRNLGVTLSYSNDGLGAARGQRFRKGPCASYPTHHLFPPCKTFLIFLQLRHSEMLVHPS